MLSIEREGEGYVLKYVTKANFENNAVVSP